MSKCCELKILGLQAVLACASCLLFAFSQSKLTSIYCVLAAKKHHSDEAEPLKNTGTETFKVSKHNTAKVLFAFLFCNDVTSRAAETSSRKIVAPVTSRSESSLLSFKQLTFAKDQERWWGKKMWKWQIFICVRKRGNIKWIWHSNTIVCQTSLTCLSIEADTFPFVPAPPSPCDMQVSESAMLCYVLLLVVSKPST